MNVVVVESPAKAKTINKYLGRDYKVVASYGHVRDLPPKDGSVRPDDDFDMSWEVDGRAEKHMKAIAEAVRGADKLFLATDPDREGEAISWHLREVLKQRRALKDVDVKRVVFNEVTRNAVLDAFRHPREIDRELVDAYLARRALDYLVGFTLSPVLWRKLPGSRSAGRVQSVALRLICEREAEVEAFRPREYWSVEVEFQTEAGDRFTAKLSHIDGKKLDRFDLDSEAKARAAADKILAAGGFNVASVEHREVRRNPFPPFTTSTLQQDGVRIARSGQHRHRRSERPGPAARDRLGRRVRRFSEALPRRPRRAGGGGRRGTAAEFARRRTGDTRRCRAEPAFHATAAALQRSQPRQETGRAGPRAPFDLRLDHTGVAGSRLCAAR